MRTHHEELDASTPAAPGFVDITDELEQVARASGIRNGQVTLFSPSAGCAIVVNERESGLLADVRRTIERLSADGALQTVVGSPSVVLPLVDGRLRLGTWQRVLLVELEEGRARAVSIQIVGE